jgi:hypothetical protein
MCIDYTSLNKTCPKDEYPLPRICQIVDSTVSCKLLSFLDAYLGYHQISHAIWNFLLHKDGVWPQERGVHIRRSFR